MFRRGGKRVQHAGTLSHAIFQRRCPGFQHGEYIVARFSVMDDHRQFQLRRQIELSFEYLLLQFSRVFIPMVVKAYLTNGNDFAMVRECLQALQYRLIKRVDIVGMDADRHEYAEAPIGKRQDLFTRDQVNCGDDYALDTGLGGTSQHLCTVMRVFVKVEVAVRIDQ